jgi:hypothetical protein
LSPKGNPVVLHHRSPELDALGILRWLRRRETFDRLPVVVCGKLSPSQEAIVERLYASCCMATSDPAALTEMLGQAIVRAARFAINQHEFANPRQRE